MVRLYTSVEVKKKTGGGGGIDLVFRRLLLLPPPHTRYTREMSGNVDDGSAVMHITVRLGGSESSKTEFKIKRKTKMGKVFKAFAKVTNKPIATLRFMYDGDRILADQTPKMLEMESGDQVDAFIEQEGGAPSLQ